MCFKEIIFQVLYPCVNFSLQVYLFGFKPYLLLSSLTSPISPKVSMSYQAPILLFVMQCS